MRTWLILDCNYLCWRAFHSTGGLSYQGVSTGVIFGFVRELIQLRELHDTERVVFCFDYNRRDLLRRTVYPQYKAQRDKTKLEKQMYVEANKQMLHLRKTILPELGYRNIFCEKGFEADDLIASIANNLKAGHEAIIVARDGDYYQLLGPRTIIWNPSKGKPVTAESFSREYGISPSQWADVKAIAGCHSDHVEGIRGVGEKTAAAFLAGRLKPKSAKLRLIVCNNKIWKRNLPLVTLPYKGTPVFKLRKDKLDEKQWQKLCKRLGFRSMHDVHLVGGQHGKAKAKGKRRQQGFQIRA